MDGHLAVFERVLVEEGAPVVVGHERLRGALVAATADLLAAVLGPAALLLLPRGKVVLVVRVVRLVVVRVLLLLARVDLLGYTGLVQLVLRIRLVRTGLHLARLLVVGTVHAGGQYGVGVLRLLVGLGGDFMLPLGSRVQTPVVLQTEWVGYLRVLIIVFVLEEVGPGEVF